MSIPPTLPRLTPRVIRRVTRPGSLTAIGVTLVLLAAVAAWLPGRLIWTPASRQTQLGKVRITWPARGQAAIEIDSHTAATPAARPVPIASIAKVMTAYVVLRHYPLAAGRDGFTMALTSDDVDEARHDQELGQSNVPVRAGEQMTEREALEALLLPSANNIAIALARRVSGSVPDFVRVMNQQSRALSMDHTVYTDPSGFDSSTTSTAADQLRLAEAAMRLPAFAGIVAMPEASIPLVGTITNTDTLLGRDGFVGIKTGSTSAAGGCFMFEVRQSTGARSRTIIGVVLGQPGRHLIAAGLGAAQSLVDGLAG